MLQHNLGTSYYATTNFIIPPFNPFFAEHSGPIHCVPVLLWTIGIGGCCPIVPECPEAKDAAAPIGPGRDAPWPPLEDETPPPAMAAGKLPACPLATAGKPPASPAPVIAAGKLPSCPPVSGCLFTPFAATFTCPVAEGLWPLDIAEWVKLPM